MTDLSWAAALQTLVLFAYVVAVDALVGGIAIAAHARLRATVPHTALVAAFRRALPPLSLAVAALGAAAWLVVHARLGADGAMLPRVGDAAALPRAVHLSLAACAVAGVLLAQAARTIGGAAAASRGWLMRHGALWAVLCTLLNLLAGVFWMAALPRDVALRFTGADTHVMITFAWALVAAILALGFVAMSLTVADPRAYLHAGTIALGITLVGMLQMREALRPAMAARPLDLATAVGACALLAAGVAALTRAARAFARG